MLTRGFVDAMWNQLQQFLAGQIELGTWPTRCGRDGRGQGWLPSIPTGSSSRLVASLQKPGQAPRSFARLKCGK